MPVSVHLVNNVTALLLLLFTENGYLMSGVQPEALVKALWWWLVVGGSLLLFAVVIRQFSAAMLRETVVVDKCLL